MKKYSIWLLFALTALLSTQCRTTQLRSTPVGRIINEGFITCFEAGLAEGKTWCEASAVLAQGERLYLANDKDMPAPRSSVFYVRWPKGDTTRTGLDPSSPIYLDQPVLRTAHKFEEFTQSPNQKWTFLTTAFDRVKPGSTDFDGYNMLLAWHPGQEGDVRIVGTAKGGVASLELRKQIQQTLGGSPYFKIEGLAATNTHLWFGVREQGEHYEKFDYRITLLKAKYRSAEGPGGGRGVMIDKPVFVRNFEVGDVDAALPKPLAISSIEYDPYRECFWILTSFEQGTTIGAYIWVISEKAMQTNGDLQLVRTQDGKPLTFTHKAEDMTFTDRNTLFIIHDDDRVRTRIGQRERQPNQAAYSVVKVN
ncbi:hypothetical protein [Fibrella forsythiae]|uniref:Lipoprotein n=1 Tax=Fibrella forsythiae TaxID=2817061 RepID=A0ABS3JDE6_9BACT|nr:hypothetical protein [Fibrella forsythiae]MBO0948024.1 hypothetical protein [Fibrella forsythiae]